MSAHTPGPWRAGIGDDYRPHLDEDLESLACVEHEAFDAIDIFCPPRRVDELDEHLANARLIAAAPDLFALVKDYISENREGETDSERLARIGDTARALVARIEGRQ